MKYLFNLSGENLPLARAEVETLFGKTIQLAKDIILLEISTLSLERALRLGYTKSIGKLFFQTNNEEELLTLSLQNTFKITVQSQLKNAPTSKVLADRLYKKQVHPLVDIFYPKHHYVFFWFEKEIYVTEEIYVNEDKPHLRRAHLKRYNHPTSMHPKLAKAMINLAATDAFIDPFCGVGGLVIEGCLMRLLAKGSDVSAEMIRKAIANAKTLGVQTVFSQQNALTLQEKSPAIITDLPYGKNSLVTEEVMQLYEKFLFLTQTLTDILVLGVSSDTNITSLIKKTSWYVERSFEIYVHKSLSRTMLLLKKH